VKRAEERGVALSELEWPEYQSIDPRFGQDLYEVFNFETSVNRRTAIGGTARSAVEGQMAQARALLSIESPGAQ
jgi:argininosuccinate lyase